MSDDSIGVNDFNIYTLGGEAVSYGLKNIHTIAAPVTEENIGIFCLEMQTELRYTTEGNPFFQISVKRGTPEDPEPSRNYTVRPGDWLIVLWDEIHLFKDKEMRHTFSFDGLSAPPLEPVEKEPTSFVDDEGIRRPMPDEFQEAKGILDAEGTKIIEPVEAQKPEGVE